MPPNPSSSSRFVSETKSRLGKCITFGLTSPSHFHETASILHTLTRNWRRIAVGHEGYITAPADRAGLARHRIAWGDHDQMGHVNNVVYNFWAETARVNWVRRFAMDVHNEKGQRELWDDLLTPRGIGLILRSIKTEYKFPLQSPDRVTVLHRLLQQPREGMDTLHLEAVVLSEMHQRVAARITEDTVVYDYRIGKKAPLPGFMVEALKREWKAQQRSQSVAKEMTEGIEARLRRIETETWDREDAVEDLGSATLGANSPEKDIKGNASQNKQANSGAGADETPLEYKVSTQQI